MNEYGAEQEDGITERQRDYIMHLLEQKDVSALFAARIIGELLSLPDRGSGGLENLSQMIELPGT